jgi:hypothetical protein
MADTEPIWGPLQRASRAAVAFLGHLLLIAVFLVGIWLVEQLVHKLWGDAEPLIWGRVPLRWLFDTADVLLFVVFTTWGAIDAHRKLRG